jgi:PAS domain-containing protein
MKLEDGPEPARIASPGPRAAPPLAYAAVIASPPQIVIAADARLNQAACAILRYSASDWAGSNTHSV